MKVWKVIFLFKNVIFRFHVCFLGGRWRFLEYVLFSPRKLGKKPPICFIFFRWVGSTTNQLITMNGTHFGGKITVSTCLFGETTIIYYLLFFKNGTHFGGKITVSTCLFGETTIIYYLLFFVWGKDVFFLHLCCLGKRIVDIILFRGNNC